MKFTIVIAWLSCLPLSSALADDDFIRGDADGSGRLELQDSIKILSYLYLMGGGIWHFDAADVNDDGFLTFEDSIWLLGNLFLIGPNPPPPFPAAGPDPTADTIAQTSVAPPPEPSPNRNIALYLIEEQAPPIAIGAAVTLTLNLLYHPDSAMQANQAYGAVKYDPAVLQFQSATCLLGAGWGCKVVDFGSGEVGLSVLNDDAPQANPPTIPAGGIVRIAFTAKAASIKIPVDLVYSVGTNNLYHYTGVGFWGPWESSPVKPPPTVSKFAICLRAEGWTFIRGDANGDGTVELADGITMLSYLSDMGAAIAHFDAVDVNDDGFLTLEDPIWLMRFIYLQGDAPRPPHPAPGFDPTRDTIGRDWVYPPPEPAPDGRYEVFLSWADSPRTPAGGTVRLRLAALYSTASLQPPPTDLHAAIRFDPQALRFETATNLLGEGWRVLSTNFTDSATDPPGPLGLLGVSLYCEACLQGKPQAIPPAAPAAEITFTVLPVGAAKLQAELVYTVGRGDLHDYTGVGIYAPTPPAAVLNPWFVVAGREMGSPFIRGDANGFQETVLTVDISDAISIFNFLFVGVKTKPTCIDALDVDDNGELEVTDPVRLLGFLFKGEPPPAPPFAKTVEGCGVDPTPDKLGCDYYPHCYGCCP
jgi:hypothetical protein